MLSVCVPLSAVLSDLHRVTQVMAAMAVGIACVERIRRDAQTNVSDEMIIPDHTASEGEMLRMILSKLATLETFEAHLTAAAGPSDQSRTA